MNSTLRTTHLACETALPSPSRFPSSDLEGRGGPTRHPRWQALLVLALLGLLLNVLGSTRVTAQQPEVPSSATPAASLAPDQPTAASDHPSDAAAEQPASPAGEAAGDDSRRVAAKVVRYAQRFIERLDQNHNGQLEREEWPAAMQEKLSAADFDQDGVIQVAEYARYITEFAQQRRIRLLPPQPGDLVELPPLLTPTTPKSATADKTSASSLPSDATPAPSVTKKPKLRRDTKFYVSPDRFPKGLPDWFRSRDRDGDGQLTISEYSPKGVAAELQQFRQLDRDGDGILTPTECLTPAEKKAATSSKTSE